MVYAYQRYADGNLQFSGNVQSATLDGECTGRDCLTDESFTTLPPTPPPGGNSELIV